jgi:hypothetical protein
LIFKVAAVNEEERTPWVKMREESKLRIKAAPDRAVIDGKTRHPMRVSKGGPAATAEKALTAEAVWPGAEFPTVEAKTASGMAVASNVAIFSESESPRGRAWGFLAKASKPQRLHRVLP